MAEPAVAAVRAPVLVIQSTTRNAQGERAPMQPGHTSPYLELLKENVPGVKIEILAGLGHFAQLEAPKHVNRLIAEFCR